MVAILPKPPPATVAAATARIEARPGVAHQPTPGRQGVPALGMTPRPGGRLPAKADGAAQETWPKTVWSRAESTPRRANGSCGSGMPHRWWLPPCWGRRWCFLRLLVTAPSDVNGGRGWRPASPSPTPCSRSRS